MTFEDCDCYFVETTDIYYWCYIELEDLTMEAWNFVVLLKNNKFTLKLGNQCNFVIFNTRCSLLYCLSVHSLTLILGVLVLLFAV